MPKVVDHAARRAELVDAAWRVIAAEGLEAATVRRIAQAAGCTTGLVTHYFDSKDDMLVAALREVHRRAGQRMIRHVGGADIAAVLLEVILDALPMDAGQAARVEGMAGVLGPRRRRRTAAPRAAAALRRVARAARQAPPASAPRRHRRRPAHRGRPDRRSDRRTGNPGHPRTREIHQRAPAPGRHRDRPISPLTRPIRNRAISGRWRGFAAFPLGEELVEEFGRGPGSRGLRVSGGSFQGLSQPSGRAMCRTWPGHAWLQSCPRRATSQLVPSRQPRCPVPGRALVVSGEERGQRVEGGAADEHPGRSPTLAKYSRSLISMSFVMSRGARLRSSVSPASSLRAIDLVEQGAPGRAKIVPGLRLGQHCGERSAQVGGSSRKLSRLPRSSSSDRRIRSTAAAASQRRPRARYFAAPIASRTRASRSRCSSAGLGSPRPQRRFRHPPARRGQRGRSRRC